MFVWPRPMLLAGLLAVLTGGSALAQPAPPPQSKTPTPVHHSLQVGLDPVKHTLTVTDTMTLPAGLAARGAQGLYFALHGGLQPKLVTKGARLELLKRPPTAADFQAKELPEGVPLEVYRITPPKDSRPLVVTYGGVIHHPLSEGGEEYARGFQETPGLITTDGVYLGRSSLWYPWFGYQLETFELQVGVPTGWEVISQGELQAPAQDTGKRVMRWVMPSPQDEIFMVGGPLTRYERQTSGGMARAFLRTPDPALASKYLEATGQYLELYSKLIGPYPYKGFALVENFWETGYGMPSFTLLGSKIIRFPFILTSSYPHEILHNWWGNGVFVDYSSGNWCEGLTAYLADHLLREQRGEGTDYRRETLQKYADYVSQTKDFSLEEFRSRHSSATEAVGYGKSSMVFHMLRLELGDKAFVAGLRTFYAAHRFQQASWTDLRTAFEKASGRSLEAFFRQWISRAGAPALELRKPTAVAQGDGYLLKALLEQTQPGEPYALKVPVAVTLEGQEKAFQTAIELSERGTLIELRLPARPLRVDFDPAFDLFRRLSREEVPPAFSGLFGAELATLVLPSKAPQGLLEGYKALANEWKTGKPEGTKVVMDSELSALPSSGSVWLLGWENLLIDKVKAAVSVYGADLSAGIKVGATSLPKEEHPMALAVRFPGDPARSLGLLAADNPASLPGMARKLPHYHKYSYLGFEGTEPTNVLKGRWPVLQSPLMAGVDMPAAPVPPPAKPEKKAKKNAPVAPVASNVPGITMSRVPDMAKLAPRGPLEELPSVYSPAAFLSTVKALTDPALKGRGFGSLEADQAAELIARAFKDIGLQPGGDTPDSYFQTWKDRGGEPEREVMLRNVIGILPGTKPELAGQTVVVGAHYDHLGLGWPDAHAGAKGQVHPGADDNASGVAVLIELARALKSRLTPDRTIVFVAFAGEEAGLRGSRQFVRAARGFEAARCLGMLNLDTVGRLAGRKVMVLGAGSAREWVHIFMGAGFTTGVQSEVVSGDPGASDHKAFIDAGIPAVQLFSGPHEDYHRPSDTADKLDGEGLVKVARVTQEVVDYLAGRPEPLTSTLGGASSAPAASGPPGGRKVSVGTVPDFGFAGPGFKLQGVSPGSPAEKAGLQAGDVIVKGNGQPVADLKGWSALLKTLSAGDKLTITYQRDGKEQTVEVTVVER